jgi:hypothetical protein
VNQTYKVSNIASYSEAFASTDDGGYILAGGDGSNAWLVKTAAQGNLRWSRSYTGRTFVSVAQTVDGGYVAAEGNKLFKTNAPGEVQWDTGDLLSDKGLYSVIVTEDGGYAVAGGSGYNVWLAKFAPESDVPPPTSEKPPSPTNVTPPPFWATVIVAVIVVAVFAAGLGLLIYLLKRK